jgi:hypothetical protein
LRREYVAQDSVDFVGGYKGSATFRSMPRSEVAPRYGVTMIDPPGDDGSPATGSAS